MPALAHTNPIEVADLETYLFEKVGPHFRETGFITKEDFWLILIWKSNRSKNASRRALEKRGTFDQAVKKIATFIRRTNDPKKRLIELVVHRELGLATASAILTVLDPDTFTVYDRRVCGQLKGHYKLAGCTKEDALWTGYQAFVAAVSAAELGVKTLREKDKMLWGKSLLEQIGNELKKPAPVRLPSDQWNRKPKA